MFSVRVSPDRYKYGISLTFVLACALQQNKTLRFRAAWIGKSFLFKSLKHTMRQFSANIAAPDRFKCILINLLEFVWNSWLSFVARTNNTNWLFECRLVSSEAWNTQEDSAKHIVHVTKRGVIFSRFRVVQRVFSSIILPNSRPRDFEGKLPWKTHLPWEEVANPNAPRSAVRGIFRLSNTQLLKYIWESVVHFGILTSQRIYRKIFYLKRKCKKLQNSILREMSFHNNTRHYVTSVDR